MEDSWCEVISIVSLPQKCASLIGSLRDTGYHFIGSKNIVMMCWYFHWLGSSGKTIYCLFVLKGLYIVHASCNIVFGRCYYYAHILYWLQHSNVWLMWCFSSIISVDLSLIYISYNSPIKKLNWFLIPCIYQRKIVMLWTLINGDNKSS